MNVGLDYRQAMLEMVKALYKAHPDAVRVQDNDGLLPLHCAAFSPGQVINPRLPVSSAPCARLGMALPGLVSVCTGSVR